MVMRTWKEFSVSAKILRGDRTSLSERALNYLLHIQDGMKKHYNCKPELVPISKKLISKAQSAHLHYKQYLQEMKNKQLEMEQKEKDRVNEIKAKEHAVELQKEKN